MKSDLFFHVGTKALYLDVTRSNVPGFRSARRAIKGLRRG